MTTTTETSTTTAWNIRRIQYYALLTTLLLDAYASQGETLMHLTLWSWTLHLLYFELPLESSLTMSMIRWLHGPSMAGAHALFVMYLWTLLVNPQMEIDLAPPGRPTWLIYLRAFWLHFVPVLFHWVDFHTQRIALQQVYQQNLDSNRWWWWQFWSSVGGYFAMGLTWEALNGDATGTYNVTTVSPEVYVAVSKVLGVVACLLTFAVATRPLMVTSTSGTTTTATTSETTKVD